MKQDFVFADKRCITNITMQVKVYLVHYNVWLDKDIDYREAGVM